jgi:hypothetical protein
MHMKVNHDISDTHLIRLVTGHKERVKTKNLILKNVYCFLGDTNSVIKLLLQIIEILNSKQEGSSTHRVSEFRNIKYSKE